MNEPKQIPHIYGISSNSRDNILSIPEYLYPLWSLLLLQLTSEGHMDDSLTDLFDRELRITSNKLAVLVSELKEENIPF